MKKLQDYAALLFIVSLIILTIISILGVWKLFEGDVVMKSFETIGLLAVVSIIIMYVGKFIDHGQSVSGILEAQLYNPIFPKIKYGTVVALVVSLVVAAFLGVLSIWEVLSSDVLNKSWASIAILGFSAVIILLVCSTREEKKINNSLPASSVDYKSSLVKIIIYVFLGLIVFGVVSRILLESIF